MQLCYVPFLVYSTDYLVRISQHSLVADIPTADLCMSDVLRMSRPLDSSAIHCGLNSKTKGEKMSAITMIEIMTQMCLSPDAIMQLEQQLQMCLI